MSERGGAPINGKWTRWRKEERGAVSVFLMLLIVPVFLFCGVLVDVVRWRAADQEAELAVKAGVRSALAGFSPQLQSYGLYGLTSGADASGEVFRRVVSGNLSEAAEGPRFRLLDHRLEAEGASLTPVYSLASHAVFKRQILEEMKYRAPMIYALDVFDKLKKTNVTSGLEQASTFADNAAKIEEPLEERDQQLDKAWAALEAINRIAGDVYPFYKTQLRDLNALSDKIGIHTVENVRASLRTAQQEVEKLDKQISSIDRSIDSLIRSGAEARESIRRLSETRRELIGELREASAKVSELESLLADLQRYAELLAMLKLKSDHDDSELQKQFARFKEAMAEAKKASEQLNEALRSAAEGASPGYAADQAFGSVHLIAPEELDRYESDVAAAVSLFSALKAQLQDGLMFTAQKYTATDKTLESFRQQVQSVYEAQKGKEAERNRNRQAAADSKRESRSAVQNVLDEVKRVMGACSLASSVDPYKEHYVKLLGDSSQGTVGAYHAYMELNALESAPEPLPDIDLDDPDRAGLGALKLVSGLGSLLTDIRDEFYIDEFAVSKFSYRTLGLEKLPDGTPKPINELSQPQSHPLQNQEVEFLIYGSGSCAGNQSLAYAEMFAFRLAIRTAEALLSPKNELLAAGSPLAVLLAALAEGAIKAQQDMIRLIQGEAVPVAEKLGSIFTMAYKDYLRLFLLLHSRDSVLLSRMQALIELNTGIDLRQAASYVSGRAETSFRLWFLPGVMKLYGHAGFAGCEVEGNRCRIVKTADIAY